MQPIDEGLYGAVGVHQLVAQLYDLFNLDFFGDTISFNQRSKKSRKSRRSRSASTFAIFIQERETVFSATALFPSGPAVFKFKLYFY